MELSYLLASMLFLICCYPLCWVVFVSWAQANVILEEWDRDEGGQIGEREEGGEHEGMG